MKKSLVGVIAVLAALFAVVVPTSSATAVEDPYPDTVCTLTVVPNRVPAGQQFTATLRSDVAMTLQITFNGDTRTRANATELVAVFRAPSTPGDRVVQGSCGTADRETPVVILPGGEDGDGDAAGDGPGGNTVAGDGDAAGDGPGGNTVAGDGDAAGDGPGGNTVAGDGDAAGDGQGGDGDSAGDGDIGNNGDSDAPPLGPAAGTQDQGPEGQGFLGGILPNTGGPAWWLLLLALILLAAGTAVVARHRRA